MPQEIRVVKCFKCCTYQTDIVKKAKKWQCKLCGEKQNIREEFGRGSGKECRQHAQKLNEKNRDADVTLLNLITDTTFLNESGNQWVDSRTENVRDNEVGENGMHCRGRENKWPLFVESAQSDDEENLLDSQSSNIWTEAFSSAKSSLKRPIEEDADVRSPKVYKQDDEDGNENYDYDFNYKNDVENFSTFSNKSSNQTDEQSTQPNKNPHKSQSKSKWSEFLIESNENENYVNFSD